MLGPYNSIDLNAGEKSRTSLPPQTETQRENSKSGAPISDLRLNNQYEKKPVNYTNKVRSNPLQGYNSREDIPLGL